MQPNSSQILDRFVWEGVVGGQTALALGLAIAVLAAWSLWRERNAVGWRWAAVFWVLRVAAFGCALWMLAGPTQQRITRTTTNQSVAIFADGSESMETVDPPTPADALRWRLAIEGPFNESAVGHCDRLSVALGDALNRSRQLLVEVKDHRPLQRLAEFAASIGAAVARASNHAEKVVAALGERDETLSQRVARIAAVIDGPVANSLSAVTTSLSSTGAALDEAFAVRLDQLIESLASARRRTAVFAADLAQSEASFAESSGATDGLSRREKAGRTLDSLEEHLGEKLGTSTRIDRFRFDRATVPLSTANGWVNALASLPAPDSSAQTRDGNPPALPRADSPAGGPGTNLTAVLEQLAAQQSNRAPRLAVIVSDGRHNEAEAAAPQEVAAQLVNVPVYVVPIGNSVEVRDVLLHRVEAPTAIAEKDSAVIDVIVTGFDCDGRASAVVLRHEGREVDRKPIEFVGGRGDQRVRFSVPAKDVGWQEYVVEVEPVDEEANTANNFQPVSFEVVRDRMSLLLADGVARWEYRYLNQLFRRDPHAQCEELLFRPRLNGTGKLAARPRFPGSVEDWSRYEVVVLGDVTPGELPVKSQEALVEYVRTHGGNLILVAGHVGMPASFVGQPLMDLLPVERSSSIYPQQGYSLRLTDEGRYQSALLIDESPQESRTAWRTIYERFPVYELSEYCRPKSTSRTLIEAVSQSAGEVKADGDDSSGLVEHAFLCWHRVGAGRVAYLAAPDTYRLRWRLGDRRHHRFWGQLLRWITAANSGTGSDIVRLQTDRTRYAAGEPVEVTVWLKDPAGRPLGGESISAQARAFNGDERSVELTPDPDVAGRYFGTLDSLAAGAYQIGVAGPAIDELLPPTGDAKPPQAMISVRANSGVEMLNTQSNRALLDQIARTTGGQVIPPTAIAEVLETVSFSPEVSERIENTPLWNRWSNLLLVLGCLFTEWIVRKVKGLV